MALTTEDEKYIAEQLADKENLKTEKDLGSVKTMLLYLSKNSCSVREKKVILLTASADIGYGIYDNSSFGIWDTSLWAPDDAEISNFQMARVINANRTYEDNFNGTYATLFKDTASTNATWTGGGYISFSANQTASSLPIFMNNETVSSATLDADDTGSIIYQLSADNGEHWETCTKGTKLTFSYPGTILKWRAYATSSAQINSLEVVY